jgi:hypothetical protein
MKELSIEEKAKRYDEAIKKLRSLHDNYDTVSTLIDVKEELENIFPELAESEDEYILKGLISMCKTLGKTKWIAWLEKQGEQKPAAWSEEDLNMYDFAIRAIGLCKQYAINNQINGYSKLPDIPQKYEELLSWLKSLKDRIQPQWKPDSSMLICLEYAIKYINKDGDKRILSKLLEQLKQL